MSEEKEIQNCEQKELQETIKEENKQGINDKYYEESINALIKYMENCEKNPSEKEWDKFAIINRHLSSKTIGYLSGIGFNKLCRNLRKEINRKKRQ